jgi:uncharacterized ion transporter superfamily protein YfcC
MSAPQGSRGSGLQIGLRSFLWAFCILVALMVAAGVLTRVIPAGAYDRTQQDGRTLVVPGSYRQVQRPAYPVWRWFTAPVEVLWSEDSLTVITIILFLVFIGGAFAVVEKGEVLRHILAVFVQRFRARKYLLMAGVMFFFAVCGGVLGIYEEAVPLVVFVVPLAHALGWDTLVGLGMSLLALAFGFASSVTNPFTVGVAQQIAGLPLFSGAGLRSVFFIVTYAIVFLFVYRYAKRIEADPSRSLCRAEDAVLREAQAGGAAGAAGQGIDASRAPRMRRASAWLGGWICFTLVFIVVVVTTRGSLPVLSTIAFPLVGVFFLIAGLGAGFFAGMGARGTFGAFLRGLLNILPAVVLILMALSAKHIVVRGGIMDTILLAASSAIGGAPKYLAAFLVYVATLVLEFFVGSASAKAFLMMPILTPLADLVGITRQSTVLAFDIADGFANMFFPTNALLLIALGLTVVGYPKWIRWTLPLQGIMFLVSMAFLAFAVATGFGPF